MAYTQELCRTRHKALGGGWFATWGNNGRHIDTEALPDFGPGRRWWGDGVEWGGRGGLRVKVDVIMQI